MSALLTKQHLSLHCTQGKHRVQQLQGKPPSGLLSDPANAQAALATLLSMGLLVSRA